MGFTPLGGLLLELMRRGSQESVVICARYEKPRNRDIRVRWLLSMFSVIACFS